ncbi:MAG: seryl-tRNA synthetase, partial [Miltoncostaeaceae bacterium]|nr:seryl-tRNA synthetase [Miltoncostaeaceae bacterium]
MGAARRGGGDDPEAADEARALGEELGALESGLRELEERRDAGLLALPNIAEEEAPEGGEDDAVELRRVGEPPRFAFEPRDHVEIGELLGGL